MQRGTLAVQGHGERVERRGAGVRRGVDHLDHVAEHGGGGCRRRQDDGGVAQQGEVGGAVVGGRPGGPGRGGRGRHGQRPGVELGLTEHVVGGARGARADGQGRCAADEGALGRGDDETGQRLVPGVADGPAERQEVAGERPGARVGQDRGDLDRGRGGLGVRRRRDEAEGEQHLAVDTEPGHRVQHAVAERVLAHEARGRGVDEAAGPGREVARGGGAVQGDGAAVAAGLDQQDADRHGRRPVHAAVAGAVSTRRLEATSAAAPSPAV